MSVLIVRSIFLLRVMYYFNVLFILDFSELLFLNFFTFKCFKNECTGFRS
jgi:hypothetical protein